MSEKHDFTDIQEVAVLGGSVDNNGLTSQSVKICSVIELGEQDIAVRDDSGYSTQIFIVPKSICIPISITQSQLEDAVLEPRTGDLVFSMQKKDWKSKESKSFVGILWEIEYEMGQPAHAHLLIDNKIQKIRYENMMVLQRCNKKDNT